MALPDSTAIAPTTSKQPPIALKKSLERGMTFFVRLAGFSISPQRPSQLLHAMGTVVDANFPAAPRW
jgi:hypothetical protein